MKILIFLLFAQSASFANIIVNDVTKLNPISVRKVIEPLSTEEIRSALISSKGPVAIGGGRFSMGGQTATPSPSD